MRRWALAAVLLLTYVYVLNLYPYFVNPNAASRAYLTLSIVDEGRLSIDPWLERYASIEDKASYGGHFYTDKAPGLSLAMVPAAYLLRKTFLRSAAVPAMMLWLRLLVLSLPAVLFWVLVLPNFEVLAGGRPAGAAVVLAGALGTNFLIYATQLLPHVPLAILLYCCWLCLSSPALDAWRAAAAGLLLGLGFITDYLACGAIPALAGYAAWRFFAGRRPGRAAAFAAGALGPLSLWAAYNRACFGGWFALGSFFVDEPAYRAAYNAGWLGMRAPSPAAMAAMLLSPSRGLFYSSPFLLLAPAGWLRLWRRPETRETAAVCAAVSTGLLLFASTTVDWMGGWAVGCRYLVPALPFLLVGVAAAVREPRWARAFGVLTLPGLLWTGAAALSFPSFPNQFTNPQAHFAWPLLAHGCLTPNLLSRIAGPWSALPFAAAFAWAAWQATALATARRAVTIALSGALAAAQLAVPEPSEHRPAQARALAGVVWDMGCAAPGGANIVR